MIKKTLFWLSSIVTILSFAFHGFAADVKFLENILNRLEEEFN